MLCVTSICAPAVRNRSCTKLLPVWMVDTTRQLHDQLKIERGPSTGRRLCKLVGGMIVLCPMQLSCSACRYVYGITAAIHRFCDSC